jgi:hypothetical protein
MTNWLKNIVNKVFGSKPAAEVPAANINAAPKQEAEVIYESPAKVIKAAPKAKAKAKATPKKTATKKTAAKKPKASA